MREGERVPVRYERIARSPQCDPGARPRGGTQLRFALGMFAEGSVLAAAAQSLAARSVAACRIEVVASQRTLAEVAGSLSHQGGTAGPAGRLIASRAADGPFPWTFDLVAVPASGCSEAGEGCAAPALDLHRWLIGRQAAQIDATLRAGGGLLLVEVRDDAHQQLVCSTLLRHAATGVQTHDIRSLGR